MDQMKKADISKSNAPQSEVATRLITDLSSLSEFDQKIVTLWNQNKTAAEIGRELNVTRNVVVGKVWRLRRRNVQILAHERPPAKPKSTSPKRQYKRTNPIAGLTFKAKHEKNEKFTFIPRETSEAKPKNISFWALKNNSCRYVMNNGRPENFIFCGAPKERGAYCEAHALICYAPPKIPANDYQRSNARFK